MLNGAVTGCLAGDRVLKAPTAFWPGSTHREPESPEAGGFLFWSEGAGRTCGTDPNSGSRSGRWTGSRSDGVLEHGRWSSLARNADEPPDDVEVSTLQVL